MENKGFIGRPKPNSIINNNSSTEDMFRKSGGFNKMRMSGASFRPSSRDGRPQSSQSAQYTFNIIPNLDEVTFASSIKMDIMQLQDEIDTLDMDGKLRSGKGMEFASPHITVMKKWLGQNSKFSNKDVDRRVGALLDTQKLLEILKVPSSEEGMKKLFKITSLIDLLINKITEYELIYLLRYDETYNTLTKNGNSTPNNTKLTMLSQGVDTKRFLASQANISRLQDMYSLCAKQNQDVMNKTGGFSKIGLDTGSKFDATGLKSRNDLIRYLDRLPNSVMGNEFKLLLTEHLKEGNEMEEKLKISKAFQEAQAKSSENKGPNLENKINQVQEQMREIEDEKNGLYQRIQTQINVIENLKKQLAESEQKNAHLQQTLQLQSQNIQQQPQQTEQNQQKQQNDQNKKAETLKIGQKAPLHENNPEYWTKLIDETKEIYEQRQRNIIDESEGLKQKIVEKNLKIEQLTKMVSEGFQKEQDFNQWKKEYFKEFKQNFQDAKGYQGAYERALLSEFERYKKAWERKIDDMEFDIEDTKKKNARNLLEYKQKLQKEEETKQLLLKKLSCFIQC